MKSTPDRIKEKEVGWNMSYLKLSQTTDDPFVQPAWVHDAESATAVEPNGPPNGSRREDDCHNRETNPRKIA